MGRQNRPDLPVRVAQLAEENLTRYHDNGDAPPLNRGPHRHLDDAQRHFRLADELAIHAALTEQLLRVRLLEVLRANLIQRYLRRDRQHRNASALRVDQPIDQMQIARPTAAGAHRRPRVNAASAAAANAAASSWRTCSQAIRSERRMASVNPLRLSPGRP